MGWVINNMDWAIQQLVNSQDQIELKPEYQRNLVWGTKTKQRLIWCILRGQDIPKFYFHLRTDVQSSRWDVVDGKQRIDAILKFRKNSFALGKDVAPINGTSVAGLRFNHLPKPLQIAFDCYMMQITQIETSEFDRIIDQFMDLQGGKRLNGQERRFAPPGFIKSLVLELSKHQILRTARISYKRLKKEEVVSRLLVWEYNNEISDTSPHVLDRFYLEHAHDTIQAHNWRTIKARVMQTFDRMAVVFDNFHPDIRNVVTFILTYWLLRELGRDYVMDDDLLGDYWDWFDRFARHLNEQSENPDAPRFIQKWKDGTAVASFNRERFAYMRELFFFDFPDLTQKDKKRRFSDDQRFEIWSTADGRCQWTDKKGAVCGVRLSYDAWDADHNQPHSKGGKTVVANGRVLCPYRNRGGKGRCPHQAPS